jgi:hypothetical protein
MSAQGPPERERPRNRDEPGPHQKKHLPSESYRTTRQYAGGARCATRPQFIRVIPDEVEQYGAAAAIVLAQIRFRTEYDCQGRFKADGVWWWRGSRVELGCEVGLSVQQVKTALLALGDAVATKHFRPLEDQSLAYRVAVDANPAELPEVNSNPVQNGCELPEVKSNLCTSIRD